MATFLDITLLENFGVIFVVLLIFLILFGLLEYIKAFGEGKKGLHAIIALAIALLFLISKTASSMVQLMVPWFMVIIIFLFFTMFLIRMFGRTEADMKKLIGHKDVYPWIIVFVALILFLSLGNAFGQSLLESGGGAETPTDVTPGGTTDLEPATQGIRSTTTSSFTTNLLNTLRHPKVMGLLFVFLIGAFALIFLTKPTIPVTPP
ncbi:hypothetical protein KY348_03855 [Candidatus Woesearchaeota archaeon]|nr:hypothetical protein [Candidatus Woesearchaeota archaeon]